MRKKGENKIVYCNYHKTKYKMLSPRQITLIYCLTDDFLKAFGRKEDKRSQLSDAEIITIAIVACFDFGGVWLHGMQFLHQYGYMPKTIHKSRLSRRLALLEPIAEEMFQLISQMFTQVWSEKEFILDSTPLEVCDNIRIMRCRILEGKDFRGYKASFRRFFYGLKLQLLTTVDGIPVGYFITEGSMHDGEAMKEMLFDLSPESIVYSDAAFTDYAFEDEILENQGIEWLTQRKSNSKRQRDKQLTHKINQRRKRIETVFSSIKNLFKRKLQAYDIESYMRKIKFFIYAFQLKFLF